MKFKIPKLFCKQGVLHLLATGAEYSRSDAKEKSLAQGEAKMYTYCISIYRNMRPFGVPFFYLTLSQEYS